MRKLFFTGLIFLISCMVLTAQVPQLINYQGFLKDNSEQPLNGQVDLHFRIFDTQTGGTALWDESHSSVNVTNGIFHVILGSSKSFGSEVFQGSGPRYLEIQVNTEILGRFLLTSVAYAMRAQTADIAEDVADNSIISARIADGAVTGNKLEDNAVSTGKIQDGSIIRQDIAAGQVVRSINSQTDQVFIGGGANVFVTQSGDTIKIDAQTGTGEVADGSITTLKLADDAVTSPKIQDGEVQNADIANDAVTAEKISTDQVVKSINTLTGPMKDNVFIEAGSNVTISTPNDSTINIAASAGGTGDVTAVYAGDYLTGGGDTGDLTLYLETAATDTVYVNHGEANSIITGMIADGAVTGSKIGADEIDGTHIADNAITNAMILNGTITGNDLDNDIITSDKIPSREIQETDLDDGIISTGKIANNAVTAVKINDEPGISYNNTPNRQLTSSTSNQSLDTLSITVPAAGYIVFEASGYFMISHVTGTNDNVAINIQATVSAYIFSSGASVVYIPNALPTHGNYRYPFITRHVVYTASPTTVTRYLVAQHSIGGDLGNTSILYAVFTAKYFPTSYQ